MAEIVRRKSFGAVLPLGRHASIRGSSFIQCASVSIALSSVQEGQTARHHKQFKLEQALVGRLLWDLVSWRGDPRAPRCPMSRHRNDPLRPLTADERQELTRLSRSLSAPAAQVERARALLAIAEGASYTAAARQVGRRHNETISAWVSRFNHEGLAAVRPGHGGGARTRYGADAQQRILAEWARTPQRDQDGTATWAFLLQRALRQAPDGLPQVSTFTIWRTLHEAGLSWQKSRTWCETGVAMRQRKHGVVRVSDPEAMAKKS